MFWVSAEHYKAPLKACQLLALTLCLGCHQASHERPLSVFASVITGSQTQHKEPNDEQIVRHPFFLLPIKKKNKKARSTGVGRGEESIILNKRTPGPSSLS